MTSALISGTVPGFLCANVLETFSAGENYWSEETYRKFVNIKLLSGLDLVEEPRCGPLQRGVHLQSLHGSCVVRWSFIIIFSSYHLCLCPRLLFSFLGHNHQPSVLRGGPFPPHGREDPEGPGRDDLLPRVHVPVRLHHHLRHVLCLPLRQDRPLRRTLHRPRLLQLHGFSRLHGGGQFWAQEAAGADVPVCDGGGAVLLLIRGGGKYLETD